MDRSRPHFPTEEGEGGQTAAHRRAEATLSPTTARHPGPNRRDPSMRSPRKTPNSIAAEMARATHLAAGVDGHFAATATLRFASADHTPAEVTTALLQLVALYAAVHAARAALNARLAEVAANAPALRKLMAGFVSFVMTTYSESPEILADFGLEQRKPPTPLTTAAQALANARRKATRDANGRSEER